MVQMVELPVHILELILQPLTRPLQAEGETDCDTFDRLAVWNTLASVDSRWRRVMQRIPVRLVLVYVIVHTRSKYDDLLRALGDSISNVLGGRVPDDTRVVGRLHQLARTRVPISSLAVLQPTSAKQDYYIKLPSRELSDAVSQLVAAPYFQQKSGPVLESLIVETRRKGHFTWTAPPDAYPRLRVLQGICGHLPLGLPPLLETLEYTGPNGFDLAKSKLDGTEYMTTAAAAIGGLQKLRWLIHEGSLHCQLPPSFLSQLPSTVQVATVTQCLILAGGFRPPPAAVCKAAAPQHLRVTEWWQDDDKPDDDGFVLVLVKLEARTRLAGANLGFTRTWAAQGSDLD